MIPPPPARAAAASPLPGFPSSPLGPSPSPHLAASSVDPAANRRPAPGRLPELLRPDDLQPRAAGAALSSSPPPLPAPTASSRLVRVAASHPSSRWRPLRQRWVSRPFYRWLAEKYPMVLVDVVEEESVEIEGVKVPVDTSKPNPNSLEYDNLYLDMNRTIHPASTPRTDSFDAGQYTLFGRSRVMGSSSVAWRLMVLTAMAVDSARQKMACTGSRRLDKRQLRREKKELSGSDLKSLQILHDFSKEQLRRTWPARRSSGHSSGEQQGLLLAREHM